VIGIWGRHPKRIMSTRLHDVPRLVVTAVYRHELFHYHVERFATRLEVIQRVPVYRPYVDGVFARVARTDQWLEEALAQSTVLRSHFVARHGGFSRKLITAILRDEFLRFPAGYRDFDCKRYKGSERAHRAFGAQVARAHVTIPESEWVTDLGLPL